MAIVCAKLPRTESTRAINLAPKQEDSRRYHFLSRTPAIGAKSPESKDLLSVGTQVH